MTPRVIVDETLFLRRHFDIPVTATIEDLTFNEDGESVNLGRVAGAVGHDLYTG